jgi:hypothetical protein
MVVETGKYTESKSFYDAKTDLVIVVKHGPQDLPVPPSWAERSAPKMKTEIVTDTFVQVPPERQAVFARNMAQSESVNELLLEFQKKDRASANAMIRQWQERDGAREIEMAAELKQVKSPRIHELMGDLDKRNGAHMAELLGAMGLENSGYAKEIQERTAARTEELAKELKEKGSIRIARDLPEMGPANHNMSVAFGQLADAGYDLLESTRKQAEELAKYHQRTVEKNALAAAR